MKTLIHDARILVDGKFINGWLLIEGERISAFGEGAPDGNLQTDEKLSADGSMLLPGLIDTHVHFREPGLTHKATIASESAAAVAGGVTSFCDMPNTNPPTCSAGALAQKMDIAGRTSLANYGFFPGVSASNLDFLRSLNPCTVPGIKLFIGSSTGNMAVSRKETLNEVFALAAGKGLPLMVHAEDDAIIARNASLARAQAGENGEVEIGRHSEIRSVEACLAASSLAAGLAEKHGTRLHIAHITSAAEIDALLSSAPIESKRITAEVTPLHLTFSTDDYPAAGARIKINPAVKSSGDRATLHAALRSGKIDTIGTDHAPHLLSEKRGGALKAASGAPMIQFALPLLLETLPPELIAGKMANAPARLFGVVDRGEIKPGNYADLVLVEECTPYTVRDSDVLSPCGWTPLAGWTLRHRVVRTWVNGSLVYNRLSGVISTPLRSKALEFSHVK